MLDMSTFYDWKHGVVNRNYNILQNLAKNEEIGRIVAVDFFPIGLKKAAKHYFNNILREIKTAEMVYGDLTSACYQKSDKIYVYSTIDSLFSWKIIARELKKIKKELNLQNVILWSYNPIFTQFIDKLEDELFVFDTVDNWAEHPGYVKLVGKNKLLKNYQHIADKADIIFTVSEELVSFYKHLKRRKDTHWIPNGVDFNHFNDEVLLQKKNILTEIEKPIIGYLGTIQERIDFQLIADIAKYHDDKIIALCGPIWDGVKEEIEKLKQFPNIIFSHGRVNYEDAPSFINQFDVAIIPHKIDNFVKSMNPMKMYDYLACGKPIVSTPGAGIEMFNEFIYIAKNNEEFNKMIDAAINDDSAHLQERRRTEIQKHSWQNRVTEMLKIIHAYVDRLT